MYIPASTTSFMQSSRSSTPLSGRCSPSATSTVTVERDVLFKHPSFSLRLQSPARRAQQQIKKAAANGPPAIVRNNSGEIVRPCLRKQAAPSPVETAQSSGAMRTPRFVHFGTDLECVRWFLKAQSPRSVSSDAMPEWVGADDQRMSQAEAERTSTVRLTGIRRPTPSYAVYEASAVVLERVELASTLRSAATLRGTIKVHNIAFEKSVAVRFSFDQWKTAHEAPAVFSRTLLEPQMGRPGVDRFVFTLALPTSVTVSLPASVALCARYSVAGAEHWDNNNGANYLFRLALPAAPAIADDDYDCDDVATHSDALQPEELRAPRRLTFAASPGATLTASGGPTSEDTRRYMAQSAALFSAAPLSGSNTANSLPLASMPELPLFQDVAWRGGDEYAARHVVMPAAAPVASPIPVVRSASPLAAPMRTGSPIHLAMFDAAADGSVVRTGSPLAWSSRHNSACAR
ncbi:hypothetical protein GGI20_001640 [Coemansia sp. BCRC 34301]|nr:hypothetical protein GGI20_001640 [Coemansia sp. BCRC 34301]